MFSLEKIEINQTEYKCKNMGKKTKRNIQRKYVIYDNMPRFLVIF